MFNDSIDNLRIDLNRKKVQQSISVRTGDTKTRTIHVSIVNNGLVYKLDQILFAEILIKKVDLTETDQGMVINGDELQYTFRTQDLSAVGENKCQIKLTGKDGSIVTTPEFSLYVYTQLVDQYKQESMNEYTAITQQLVEVNRLAGEVASNTMIASEAASSASQSAETALEVKESVDESVEQIENFASEAMEAATIAATKASEADDSAKDALTCKNAAIEAANNVAIKAEQINSVVTAVEGYAKAAGSAKEASVIAANMSEIYAERSKSAADSVNTDTEMIKASKEAAEAAASEAEGYATSASQSAQSASDTLEAVNLVKDNIETTVTGVSEYAETAIEAKNIAVNAATQASSYETQVKAYADLASKSADNALESERNALASKNAAATSETNAATSASAAETAASTATAKAGESQTSADNAASSEENAELAKSAAETAKAEALLAESNAQDYAADALESADNAEAYYGMIAGKYNDVKNYADLSQSYAVGTENVVRDNDATDNAKSYYEKTKQISEGLAGGLIPMGTLVFDDLPALSDVTSGWMYNISNDFTSDERFKDGSGLLYLAGTNVYKTADGYWDCTAGSTARMNSSLNTVTFAEAGTRENIGTGESHATLFGKIKKFFADLSSVAFSGSYNDLTNKPDIPSKVSELSNDSGYAVASSLATVATSGSYNDLTGKPTIPSAVTEGTVSGWGVTKNTGTYSKPSGGIPKTDLADAVQTSLGKADTALQSYTEKYTGTYSKPSGGIPATDLAAAVQTSLGKADSALQSVSKSDVGLGNVGNFKAVSTVASQGLSDTEKANARANIGAGTSSFSGSYNDLSGKPTIPSAVTDSTVSGWGYKKFTEVTGTLAANATSLVLSNSAITTSSTVEIFSSVFGVSPTAMTVAAGKVTLTFEKQTTSVSIKARIS